ncbi:MAG: carbohydrate kinase [Lentisphaeria bacterium]|nr:carbohydrate kinase [Lentisphaeria bacterium]
MIFLCFGEILWDVFPDGKQLGGSPANVAFHLDAQGVHSIIISAVGKDDDGQEILDHLAKNEISTAGIAEVDYPTGRVDVEVDSAGVPSFTIRDNVAWDHINVGGLYYHDLPGLAGLYYSSIVLRDEPNRKVFEDLIKIIPKSKMRVYDVNIREPYITREIIELCLSHATILKVSDEEIDRLIELLALGSETHEMACQDILDYWKLDAVIFTMGDRGAKLLEGNQWHSSDPVKVKLADTVGAGDSFTATCIAGRLSGADWNDILPVANRVAAFVCSQPGATPKLKAELFKRNS